MELDLSRLNALVFRGFEVDEADKRPATKPTEELLGDDQYKSTTGGKSPANEPIAPTEGTLALQREADAIREEREQARKVYKAYQDNTKLSEGLKADILKGIRRGEDIYPLFLKAAQAISLMTSDTVFYRQIEADIKAIYGAGLLQRQPLEIELKETQTRLDRLRDAERRETGDSRERIRAAIRQHEAAIAQIEEQLKTIEGGESKSA